MNRPYIVDSRTHKDILTQIETLAGTYTPEWVPVLSPADNPDIGSVIAHIFSRQLAENIQRLNYTPQRCHNALGNMLGIGLMPARPAQCIVVAELTPGTENGVDIPAGTRFIGNNDDGTVPFESLHEIRAAAARLAAGFIICAEQGKIIPLDVAPDFQPFKLMDVSPPGIEQNKLYIRHDTAFDIPENAVLHVACTDTAGYAALTDENKFIRRFESPEVLCIEALGKVDTAVRLQGITITSHCTGAPPSFVSHNDRDMERDDFMPFGDEASLYSECYIGNDKIFGRAGAKVSLDFELYYREKRVALTTEQIEAELKLIKRKPKKIVFDTASACVQAIAVDYFNGTGWKRLQLDTDCTALFDGRATGEINLTFVCPDDWQPMTVGAYHERAIRITVTRADNCYLRPCLHTMPVIKDLSLSYAYPPGGAVLPQSVTTVCGTTYTDVTSDLFARRPFTAFAPLPYRGDALYLGFEGKIDAAPFSMFFEIDSSDLLSEFKQRPYMFEYSTLRGWSRLRVRDETRGLTASGTVGFLPGSDFAAREVAGRTHRWIRITPLSAASIAPPFAVINQIIPNAIRVHNVKTLREENYYIETPTAHMSFPLEAEGILSATVKVNEGITGFVEWREVENFDASKPGDRHYVLNRKTMELLFGDGMNVRIPLVTDDVAFTVQVRCCNGAGGNLPPGAIGSTSDNILFIDKIYNPIAAYGGSDMESPLQALERSTAIINTKNRLVSEMDYIREVTTFSGNVASAKCVINDGRVTIAVLMKDYANGSYSFDILAPELRQWILSRCETTIDEALLEVILPEFVVISADVWLRGDQESGFEARRRLTEKIQGFIDPQANRREIGRLPSAYHFKTMLNAGRDGYAVRHFNLTAAYNGKERTLSELAVRPFMVGINGTHSIHVH